MESSRDDDAVLAAVDQRPVAPAQQAMNGVPLLGLGEGELIGLAVEAEPTVGEPVGPRDQRRPVGSVAHVPAPVRLKDITTTVDVLPQPAAHLDHGCPLLAEGDLELLT